MTAIILRRKISGAVYHVSMNRSGLVFLCYLCTLQLHIVGLEVGRRDIS